MSGDEEQEQPAVEVHVFAGRTAMEFLLSVYLSGFASGTASTLSTIDWGGEERIEEFVNHITQRLMDDPLSMEGIKESIREIMHGPGPNGPRGSWPIAQQLDDD